MKNKSLFNKISLLISIVILFLILILSVLGSFNRVGYLSEFKLISSKKNIYTYNFRIKYHSKVFRNSDIYGVYINSKNIINANKYIRKITMNEIGSPFGILESNRKINGDIDNIVYTLKLKKSIIILSLVLVMILLLNSIIIDFIKKLSKFNFRNRYAYILIIFLCFLIMPSIIYKIFYDKFDHTNYEKRSLAKKPVFSINNLYKYPSEYEKYFNDHVALKNELTKLIRTVDMSLFNYIIDSSLLYGIDKNAYWKITIKDYVLPRSISTNTLIRWKNNIMKFRNELKNKNIDFIFMIAPSKTYVYNDKLPNYIKKFTNMTSTEHIIKYLKDNTDIKILYPLDELIKYKDRYRLYMINDPHWNALGAYISYTYMMKQINITNMLDIDKVDIGINTNIDPNNVYQIPFLNVYNTYIRNMDYEYFIGYTTNKIVYKKEIIDKYRYIYTKSYSTNNKNVVLIGDSFSSYIFGFVKQDFNETTYIYRNIQENRSFNFNRNFKINDNCNLIILVLSESNLYSKLLSLF
ncbi:hypothetical protein [Brachyspira innocens]|uniref:alginate O-acetyltransferase AlgX-related protein n=1 Tax=Brachyspira innocens TaxID=13264 RepID=UPI0026EA72EB|nr:hypothetical protein [Brachyspira innocens]